MRTVAALLLGSLVLASHVNAHDVVWPGNPDGTLRNTPIVLVDNFFHAVAEIAVQPEFGEPCVVQVNLDFPLSTLVEAKVVGPNPAVKVLIKVESLRPPFISPFETATISGDWQATGQPPNKGCNAPKTTFAVPVHVYNPPLAATPNAITTGDPVSTWTGEFAASVVDLSLGGPLPLRFARSYGSQPNASGSSSAMGSNWMHNFDSSLSIFGSIATVSLYPGKGMQFQKTGNTWKRPTIEQQNYQLVETGGNYEFVSPADGLIYTFSNSGKLASIRDRNGNTLTVTQGPAGPVLIADGLGRTLTFGYTGNLLTSVMDQTGRKVTFAHTGANLTGATDANGKTTLYSYTSGAQPSLLIATQRPVGNTPWTQQFDGGGRVTTQTDSFGKTTTLAYDQPLPGARAITDPLGGTAVHLYEGPGNLSQLTDPMGQSTLYDYDTSFRLARVTDRLGNETDLAYDPASGYVASVLDAEGHATTNSYTQQAQGPYAFFNLTGIQYADGTAVALTYDAKGNVVGVTDQAGNPFAATYNARGQLLTATNPSGGVVSIAYNSDGTIGTVTDPVGGITAYTYDNKKRLSRVTFADGTSRSFTYDAVDRLLTATDERGNVMKLATDDNGNLKSVTDPLNRTVTISYDTDDLVRSVTDPSGRTASFHYDALGSLTSATNAAGETLSSTYDALGRLTSVADPSGKGPTFTYDQEGNLAGVADALGNIQTFATDRLGRKIQWTSPLGEQFSRAYDAMGRVASMTDSLARNTSFSYDSRGLLTGIGAPGGAAASFAHDDLGMLSAVTDPNGHLWLSPHDTTGRLIANTDPLGRSVFFSYDARGRVKVVTSPVGSLQITRDAAGNVTRRQYSDGLDLTTTFDSNHRPTSGTGVVLSYDPNGRLVASNGLTITRDAIGRIASITYAPGKTVTYAYDARGLLASVSDWSGGSASFAYDAAARLTGITRANGVSTQISYDPNNRISTIDEAKSGTSLASIALQRDALGRVTYADRNLPQQPAPLLGTLAQSYDDAAQRVGAGYDGLGRITQDPRRTYTWNVASELMVHTAAAGSVTFGYDAFGLRTSRTPAGGSAESYVLNYALGLPSIAIVRAAGADLRYYVHLPDGALLYAIDVAGNAHHYYHFDEIGSTVFLTGDSGTVTDSYGITPYGETVTTSGSTANPFTWLGRWGVMQEGATGLYYMRARYYDSASVRFLSRDPIRQLDPRAINPYQYASGDPLSQMDPTGLKGQGIGSEFASVYAGNWYFSDLPALVSWGLNCKAAAHVAEVTKIVDVANSAINEKTIDGFLFAEKWAGEVAGDYHFMRPWSDALRAGRTTLNFEEFVVDNLMQNQYQLQRNIWAESAAAEQKAAAYASKLRTFGTGLLVIGGVIQTGAALAEDVRNGADIVVTTTDVSATSVSVAALAAAPPLAIADLATGGAVSGGIHNALMTPNVVGRVLLGRVNSGDQAAIKATYTRFAVGRWAWDAGAYWDEKLGCSDALANFLP